MSKPKIAIILSTARAARFGHKAGQWIHDIAKERSDMEFDLVDLRDHPLPFFDEIASNVRDVNGPDLINQDLGVSSRYDDFRPEHRRLSAG